MMIVSVHQVQVLNTGTANCQPTQSARRQMILHIPTLWIKNVVDPTKIQADQLWGIFDASLQQRLVYLWPKCWAAAEAEVLWTVSLQGLTQGQGIQPGPWELQGLQVTSLRQALGQWWSSRPVNRVWARNRHKKNSEMLWNMNAEHRKVEQEQGLVYLKTSAQLQWLHSAQQCILQIHENMCMHSQTLTTPGASLAVNSSSCW